MYTEQGVHALGWLRVGIESCVKFIEMTHFHARIVVQMSSFATQILVLDIILYVVAQLKPCNRPYYSMNFIAGDQC